MLCLTLTGRTMNQNSQLFSRYEEMMDWAELRVDYLEEIDADGIKKFLNRAGSAGKPVILTCRRERDGGQYRQQEKKRTALLKKLMPLGFSYADIEEDVRNHELEAAAAKAGVQIIRSFHQFGEFPSDFFSRIEKIRESGEIPKAAVMIHSCSELMKLFDAEKELRSVNRKIIVGMGPAGIPSRILYKKTGSLIMYCSADHEEAAPGHLTLDEMKNLYHADAVTDDTRIYGIIGNPVLHSSSPKIHNPAFAELGIDAVYIPFHTEQVRDFFSFAEKMKIQGFSVTVPHKQAVLPYLGKISREVKLIGSCNTVVRQGNMWKGINTDYYGFLQPIYSRLEQGAIRNAVVIGAGGAARSVVWALRNHQCSVTILNRTPEKAERLAAAAGARWRSLDTASSLTSVDLIVQTTSVGMTPHEGEDPIPEYQFTGREIVYDLVYKPQMTAFLERAQKAGAELIFGREMLIAQGKFQFEVFTGSEYPFPEDAVVF